MGLSLDDDFQAESDAHALIQGKEVEKDPGRIARARGFIERQRDKFADMAKALPDTPVKVPNGTVRNSKMEPK